jgi:hypothetical protein
MSALIGFAKAQKRTVELTGLESEPLLFLELI